MVGIDKVLHHDVMEDLTLLFHHLVQHRVRVPAQQKDRKDADVAEGRLITPGLSDGLPRIKLFVGGADENDQKGRDAFAFLGLIDDKLKGVWVKGAGADVVEGDVFMRFHSLPYRH